MRALRRSRTATVGVLTVAVLLVLSGVLAASEADGAHVLVFDNAYHDGDDEDPTTTRIEVGETVHWRWDDGNENEHTVTAASFDSDDECAEVDDESECRQPPNTFSVTFDEPGTYEYWCKNHGFSILSEPMRGTVEVVEPEPQDSPSPSPEPSPSPTEDPDDGADDGDDADGADDGEDADDRDDTTDASGPTRSSGQAARPPAQRMTPSERAESDADAAAAADPDVAPPEPDFEPFPTPSPVDATPTPEIGDDLAVDIPPPGGIPRDTLIVIAFATLAATLGAFGKVVLFGGTWG